jgi:hypothetical protein
MITALKDLYEQSTKDLGTLKQTYKQHANECIQAAKLTFDPIRREEYLKLARQWTEAADVLQAPTEE